MNSIVLFVCVNFVSSIQLTLSEWSLEFSDEFNGEELDSRYWASTKELSEKKSIFLIEIRFQFFFEKFIFCFDTSLLKMLSNYLHYCRFSISESNVSLDVK
jgi:hypothetical protein